MATQSSILTWRILQTEERGGVQSISSQRVGHNWSDQVHMHIFQMLVGTGVGWEKMGAWLGNWKQEQNKFIHWMIWDHVTILWCSVTCGNSCIIWKWLALHSCQWNPGQGTEVLFHVEHRSQCVWKCRLPKSESSSSESCSVVSDSLGPHGLYSPWNSPGQNTGVGSLSLLQQKRTQIQRELWGLVFLRQTAVWVQHVLLSGGGAGLPRRLGWHLEGTDGKGKPSKEISDLLHVYILFDTVMGF